MLYEITENKIKYSSWATGPQGSRFELYPILAKNTIGDVKRSQLELYNNYDVVKIYIVWITQDQYDNMMLWLHPIAKINKHLNELYHDSTINH